MCLAVAGKIIELSGENAVVEVRGNQINAVTALVPEAKVNDYVLLHAGFAISLISKQDHDEQVKIFEELRKNAPELFQPE